METKSETAAHFEDLLQDARILADFSKLNAAEVNQSLETHPEHFRSNYPNFVPEVWWVWEIFKSDVIELDKKSVIRTPFGEMERGPTLYSKPSTERECLLWQLAQQLLREAWQDGFPLEKCVKLISLGNFVPMFQPERTAIDTHLLSTFTSGPITPYQKAVMFLVTNPWRAKFCGVCGKRFVAGEPKQALCSEKCRQEAEIRRKRKWWNRSGKSWRRGKAKSTRKRA
jgi:predicted nucleic acid-binding Zn ribbon protein